MDDGQVTSEPTPQSAGDSTADVAQPPARPKVWVTLVVVAVAIIVADLVSKIIAVAVIDPGDPVEIIGDTITFKLVRNSGAAFSMATGYTWVLTIVALAVVVGIVRYSNRLGSVWWAVGLGLVLGGAVGNLIDRMFRSPGVLRGHVIDFVSVGWWPVFNVADSAVVCGAILLVGLTLFGFEFDGTRAGDHRDDDHRDDADTPTTTKAATDNVTTDDSTENGRDA
ncbi:signal peptidase II [Nocardia sp. 348MFTsu5.1]|uniref:signal peptidase II n=1 Tax=Nocardia sp. 348MFTsu5.1 TaxID=1172185 RepID=UPI00037F247F